MEAGLGQAISFGREIAQGSRKGNLKELHSGAYSVSRFSFAVSVWRREEDSVEELPIQDFIGGILYAVDKGMRANGLEPNYDSFSDDFVLHTVGAIGLEFGRQIQHELDTELVTRSREDTSWRNPLRSAGAHS